MSEATRTRGPSDTSAPLFKLREPARRAVFIPLALALLIHLPLIPSRLLAWLELYMMMEGSREGDDLDGEVILPLDLDLVGDTPGGGQTTLAAPPPPSEPAEPESNPAAVATNEPKPPKKHLEAGLDAGTSATADAADGAAMDAPQDASPAAPTDGDGGLAKLGSPDASDGLAPFAVPIGLDAGKEQEAQDAGEDASPDAGEDAENPAVASAADAGAPKVRDPTSQAGGPARLAKSNNVEILIAGDRIRTHELGDGFGKILRNIPQWNDFFANTAIDPIKHIDHIFLAGPQFKADSSRVIAVMDYNRSDKEIRETINIIVMHSKGEWLKDSPIPAAQSKADKADRIFAMIPGKRMLVILPVSQKDQLGQLKDIKPFNKSSPVGIAIAMVSPAKAFKEVVKLPDSLKKLRLEVTPTSDGGADLTIELEDTSSDDAVKHAAELTSALELFRLANQIKIPFTSITIDVIDKTVFLADGSLIRTSTHLTVKQLRGIMAFAEQQFREQRMKQDLKAKGKAR